MAGLTVCAVALPLALAFGVSSGATAAAGLVTAIIAGDVYKRQLLSKLRHAHGRFAPGGLSVQSALTRHAEIGLFDFFL